MNHSQTITKHSHVFYKSSPCPRHEGTEGVEIQFHSFFTLSELSGYLHAPAALCREVIPVLTKQEATWATKPVCRFWRREKYLAPTGIRTLDRPFHSIIARLTPKAFYTAGPRLGTGTWLQLYRAAREFSSNLSF